MRRARLALALAAPLALLPLAPVTAAAPDKSAWFTALAAGPVAAPAPSAAEGDLRVAGSGSHPTAYAALALRGAAGGTLTLALRPEPLGAVELAVCPTRGTDWKAGGNQPFAAGPEYDCTVALAFGTLRADGSAVDFDLDASFARGDLLDVAVVPVPDADAPFSVDLAAPDGSAFQPTPAPPGDAAPAGERAPEREPAPAAEAAPPLALADPGGLLPAAPVLEAAVPVVEPEIAALPEPAPDDAPAPAVAPAAPDLPLVPVPAVAPARLAAAARQPDDGPRLLALLALIGVSAGAGYAAGQQRTQPRLLGGRARAVPAAGAALAVPAAPPSPAALPRGIGRFSRVRDTAPRRLR